MMIDLELYFGDQNTYLFFEILSKYNKNYFDLNYAIIVILENRNAIPMRYIHIINEKFEIENLEIIL